MTDARVRLSRLQIQSFKSLDFVDLELGTVNVFIGANGSGKSNLLESLGYLSAVESGQLDDQALLRRGVRPGPPGAFAIRLRELPAPPTTKIVAHFSTDEGVITRGATYRAGGSPDMAPCIDATGQVESGMTLSSLWLMGRLGGAPDLF